MNRAWFRDVRIISPVGEAIAEGFGLLPPLGARRRVVVIGAGYGDVDVIVIDRRNHDLFQPLLCQVATS